MDIQKAESYFLALSGCEAGEREKFLPFLQGAMEEIEEKLSNEIGEKDFGKIERLCGALAFYRLSLSLAAKEEESLRLGEISLKGGKKERLSAARELLLQHYKPCEALFRKESFAFGRVRIEL